MAANSNGHLDAPADNRVETGSVNVLPEPLPTASLPAKFDVEKVAADFVESFLQYLNSKDYGGLASLFLENGYWRDHLCLSWDLRTLKGPGKISEYLASNGSRLTNIALDKSAPHRAPQVAQLDAYGKSKCVAFFISATTDVGSALGVVRLVHDGGAWKVLALYTGLQELKGFEEPRGRRRPKGAEHSGSRGMKNWQEKRISDTNFEDSEPQVLVIGTQMHVFAC